MQKFIINVLVIMVGFACLSQVAASEIPKAEKAVLEKTFAGMKVRFDGMIELKDGTKYIPVYPIRTNLIEKEPKIVKTVPANKKLASKPDFFMFDTNFAFFKVINKNGVATIISGSAIPQEIKMGLLPQDLLVPVGFQIPSEYRIMIGDLVIPMIPSEEYKEVYVSKSTLKNSSTEPKTVKTIPNGTIFYATSFNTPSLMALNASNGQLYKKIDFSSIPSDFKMVRRGNYMLLTTTSKPKLYVIDANKAEVLKEIEVGKKPSGIAISEVDGVAYVANKQDGTISVIDLRDMSVKETIDVLGNPSFLTLSYNEKQLYYLDGITGTVYALVNTPNYFTPYISSPLFKSNNINQIQFLDNKLYTFNRSSNELEVFYIEGTSKQKELLRLTYLQDEENEKKRLEERKLNLFDKNMTKKEKYNLALDKLLRRNEEEVTQKHTPIYEEIMVLQNDNLKINQQQFSIDENESFVKKQLKKDSIVNNEEQEKISVTKSSSDNKNLQGKSKIKEKIIDFITYKQDVKKPEKEEIVRKRNDKMDFVKLPDKSNAFLALSDKIYVLASDQYKIFVLDENYETVKTIDLEKLGYYNSMNLSLDGKQLFVTNISSKEINVVDIKNDKVIQKLPLSINVHRVVMFNKDGRL